MRRFLILIALAAASLAAHARGVTLEATDRPAAEVFRLIMEQTGKNFVYPSDLLEGVRVSVHAADRPLRSVLRQMFDGTGIEFKIKGNNVVLKRANQPKLATPTAPAAAILADPDAIVLPEVVVVSRLEVPEVESAEMGARKVTARQVLSTPALFGESDVIKTIQLQPGVAPGAEGMAGMHVHGGEGDQNLFMLDNVPLYQVNHFAGLFSAFNADIVRYIDFFKTSVPAKYDGRLSSFMDVRLSDGNADGHHGTARLGLTSGAFNIGGPIGRKTTYVVGLRRSWFDVLTIPAVALFNSGEDEKMRFHYYFMDLNAKVRHRLSDRASLFAGVYFGDDLLRTGTKDSPGIESSNWIEDDRYDLHWGNLVAQLGANYRFRDGLTAEFTAAYTQFFSNIKHDDRTTIRTGNDTTYTRETLRSDNNVKDWIFRGDFHWQPDPTNNVRFGAAYVRHSFLPGRMARSFTENENTRYAMDSTSAYHADQADLYIEDEWRAGRSVRLNAGIHASLFAIDGKVRTGLSPRLSVNWQLRPSWAVKAAYSRTVQYVHQLSQSYLALPTDQWIPVSGSFKPETADKIAVGLYTTTANGMFAFSAEAYIKWMRNMLDYRDEYYLRPPLEMWDARLTAGRGSAKGIDLKVEKTYGRLTGMVAYSLAWADRTFAEKNGGRTYPARFDNRHSIKVALDWKISDRVSLNAVWIGHSGNRFTLLTQMWEGPDFGSGYTSEVPVRENINNWQLPFYHRLDLGLTVRNSRGYWQFGLYNAYCHLNTIGIRRATRLVESYGPGWATLDHYPVFQKVRMLPIIPSVSYTWQF